MKFLIDWRPRHLIFIYDDNHNATGPVYCLVLALQQKLIEMSSRVIFHPMNTTNSWHYVEGIAFFPL